MIKAMKSAISAYDMLSLHVIYANNECTAYLLVSSADNFCK